MKSFKNTIFYFTYENYKIKKILYCFLTLILNMTMTAL